MKSVEWIKQENARIRVGQLVAIRADGETQIHFPHPTGNYATLCGMDGNDPDPSVAQSTVDVPRGAKVNCQECISIFDVVKGFGELDLDRRDP